MALEVAKGDDICGEVRAIVGNRGITKDGGQAGEAANMGEEDMAGNTT
jgi:hypothetical protein